MKPGMTSLLYKSSNVDPKICVRLARDLETGEYATYLNFNEGDEIDDKRGHYFHCEGATYLAHKLATDDFFQRIETGI